MEMERFNFFSLLFLHFYSQIVVCFVFLYFQILFFAIQYHSTHNDSCSFIEGL